MPREPQGDWIRHIYRESNDEADTLAKRAVDLKASYTSIYRKKKVYLRLRAFSDGSKSAGGVGCGVCIEGSNKVDSSGFCIWETAYEGSWYMGMSPTIVAAELNALSMAVAQIASYARYGEFMDM